MNGQAPPVDILKASAALEHVEVVDILRDWQWYDPPRVWALGFRLHVDSADRTRVPPETDWFALVDKNYPLGRIHLAPAETRSITGTFQHQNFNAPSAEGLPWRTGNICSETSLSCINRRAYDEEPFEAEKRLPWRLLRTCDWLRDAANGTLVRPGDPFELPDYRTRDTLFRVAFLESTETWKLWHDLSPPCGLVKLGVPSDLKETRLVLSFQDLAGNAVHELEWSSRMTASVGEKETGVWILFPDVIVLPPWQAPMTWGELLRLARQQRLNVRHLITQMSRKLRDGREHLALLGFPISRYIGTQPNQVHWQALLLPAFSSYGDTTPGFSRPGEAACQVRDHRMLSGATKLNWQKAENWHQTEIFNRGMFTSRIRNSHIVFVGGGALGCMLAEILVRGGARELTVIDPDRIEIGNLARHTLSISDLGMPKPWSLAARLRGISPQVEVNEIADEFEKLKPADADTITHANLVLDTTGNDDVLHFLEKFDWADSPFLASISVGLQAKRLYVFTARRRRFSAAFFLRHVKKWLEKDGQEYDGGLLPVSGGIGCWHPAFPARVDDMWLLASTAIKYFEDKLQSDKPGATLAVFEQQWKDGSYCGVSLVREEHDNG